MKNNVTVVNAKIVKAAIIIAIILLAVLGIFSTYWMTMLSLHNMRRDAIYVAKLNYYYHMRHGFGFGMHEILKSVGNGCGYVLLNVLG